MLPSVKMNFQTDIKFASELWSCEGCSKGDRMGKRDTQHHILKCPAYEKYRLDRYLDDDSDLVNYYKGVLQQRMELL